MNIYISKKYIEILMDMLANDIIFSEADINVDLKAEIIDTLRVNLAKYKKENE